MIRIVGWLALAACLLVGTVDGGSIILAKLQVPDDVRTAGQVAAADASGKPVDQRTAIGALASARAEAGKHDITITATSFFLQPDGRITLTGTKTAPTLVAGHIGALRELATTASTVTVTALPFR